MSFRLLKLVLTVVVAGFVVASIYISTLEFERQHELRRISRYNPTWQASQTLLEFMRLQQCLYEFQATAGRQIKRGFSFDTRSWSGQPISSRKAASETQLRATPELEDSIRDAQAVVAALEPLLANLDRPGAIQDALGMVRPIQRKFREVLAATYNDGAELASKDARELARLHWLSSSLIGALILFGLALIGLLARHNILLGRTHQKMGSLAADLAHLAHHDPLTGLANRILFRERLEQALETARVDGSTIAVLYLDLDLFKNVNDTLGHETGDELLKIVATRIRSCVRTDDVIARLGGDEFAVLATSINIVQECAILASCIVKEIGAVYDIDGHEIVIGTSIGIATTELGISSPEQLLKQADTALYRAKADGRGVFRFFHPEMDAKLQARRALEVDLRKAMANDEFCLVFQPQVNLATNEITGFEALLRWHHPDRGTVSPSDFIPVAEDIGLIVPLGEWVMTEACMAAIAWPANLRVAVNLSSVQFRSRTLVQSVHRAIQRSGIAASRLELELTESTLLNENAATLSALYELRALGVRISLDDFGTGYSSLSYLRSFPFDKIKIDQSFVRELSTRADCKVIVQSMVSLGAGLGMSIIAEGVETEDQLRQLRAAGCTDVQGYYFGRPVPASELVFSLPVPAQA